MSTSPMSPEDISPDVKQGALAGLLGMMGMAVKIILTDDKLSVGKVLTRLFVAMVVAVLSGFALDSYIENKKMLWALNGLSGYMALEVVAWAEGIVRARLSGELNKVQKSAGLKPAKSKPRGAKPKARR